MYKMTVEEAICNKKKIIYIYIYITVRIIKKILQPITCGVRMRQVFPSVPAPIPSGLTGSIKDGHIITSTTPPITGNGVHD